MGIKMRQARAPRRVAPQEDAGPRLTYLVGRLNRALRKRLGAALLPFKLSVAQYTTLSVLQLRANLSNAQLAKRAFISPQAMNEVIQGLEARRLVARRASSSHGRIVQLLLTRRGLELMHDCDTAVDRLEQSMLAGLTGGERKLLGTTLASCTHALEYQGSLRGLAAAKSGGRARREAQSAPSGT